ncbi:probable G-protein coupled receptor 139 [Hemiscyllium ocellatum]|uniref:probable G-protein coupled receptor 139 n=1 Tax=Hemiscyllium ocellatum TaxID=170820 RepID=UPI002965DDB5|nr:probable G-protein coupled receptor 139 [Hemiscyllium ocellatum]
MWLLSGVWRLFGVIYLTLSSSSTANVLAIIILSQGCCGLSRCITFYLLAIAVADFLVIISGCILNRIGRIYFSYSVLSTTPGCSLTAVLIYATRDCSVWLTVAFTFDRFVAICCQSLKTRYCTEKTASRVIGLICVLLCIKNVPFYFIYKPLYILDAVPWFCDIKAIFHTSPTWQVYRYLNNILVPFLPLFLIVLFNALTVRHIVMANRARERLRGAGNDGDSEMVNRKRSIVLLFAISLRFLLLWVTYIVRFLHRMVTGEEYVGKRNFNDPKYILQETTNMLTLLSSCNNIFIYVVSQKMFREELKKILMRPFQILTAGTKW